MVDPFLVIHHVAREAAASEAAVHDTVTAGDRLVDAFGDDEAPRMVGAVEGPEAPDRDGRRGLAEETRDGGAVAVDVAADAFLDEKIDAVAGNGDVVRQRQSGEGGMIRVDAGVDDRHLHAGAVSLGEGASGEVQIGPGDRGIKPHRRGRGVRLGACRR